MMMGWESGWGWVGAVWMLLFWVLLVILIVWGCEQGHGAADYAPARRRDPRRAIRSWRDRPPGV